MRSDEGRRVVGLARVFGALWFIVAGVVAETLVRIQHNYFFALIALTAGVVGLVAPIQNLNPDVLMMGSAEDRYRCDATELLGPAKIRSIFVQ